jgi:glycosyltransferase involved in cell wall biosynthesis
LHGRGYYAGLILRLVKKRDKSLITIFDPRSPYIKEMISTYNKKEKSSYIKKWKELEKSIINENDYTISVSESLKLYYKNILKNYIKRNIITIPNCVNLIPKDHIKKIINLNRRNSICYVGSIGNGWNNLDFYIENIKIINNYFPNIKFEFYVIEKNPGELREKLIKNGISKDIFIIDTVDPAEIPYKIAGCLAGLQLMKNKDERMGIKVVDYLGAGIPIITNTLAMGSTEIVTKFEVGIVEEMTIGNKSRLYLSKIINNKNERIYYEEKCLNISYKNFSIESIAKKYNKIYKRWKY